MAADTYTRPNRRSRRLLTRFQRGIQASNASGSMTRMARRRSKRKPMPRVVRTSSLPRALASKPE
ncbi:hypothetical protein D3C72_2212640 [compost metagenome]